MMITKTFTVTGMTCAHCVQAVTSEISALAQVSAVDVDLPTGAVTVTSATTIDIEALRVAVDEAGYELVR